MTILPIKRIGITQRVSSQFHGQPHDCLDQAWANLLLDMGYHPVPLPNLAGSQVGIATYLSGLALDGLILSGGNDIAGQGAVAGSEISERRDHFERMAIIWARHQALPVLGVCRGMQFLNVVLGGTLSAIKGHAGTRHRVSRVNPDQTACFSALPQQIEVNSYHNFAISADGLAAELIPAAIDEDGGIEAFVHSKERIAAMMWHPERTTPFCAVDKTIIDCVMSTTRD